MAGVFTHMLGRSGAAAGTPAVIAVQDFTVPTTGTQDVTSSAISGVTPAAALFLGSYHLPANDPGNTGDAMVSLGAANGSAQRAMATSSYSAQASVVAERTMRDDSALLVNDPPGGGFLATYSAAMISGGARLTFGGNNCGARKSAMVAFAGADVQSAIGTASLGSAAGTITITTGFRPDVVIFFANNTTVNNVSVDGNFMGLTLGIALADETQRCVMWSEQNAAAAGAPVQSISDNKCAGQMNGADGTLTYGVVADNFTSSGFDLVVSASAGGDHLPYLALKFPNRVALVSYDTPTSTGAHSVTGLAFEPQFALAVVTNLEAWNATGTSTDNMSGLGISFIGDEQWASGFRIDSGADPTSATSVLKSAAIVAPSATTTQAGLASFTSFNSDGMTVNYSAAQGTAKKGFILFVE